VISLSLWERVRVRALEEESVFISSFLACAHGKRKDSFFVVR
jgi:hypothetical protein